MSESSTKPYFVRAVHQWCSDNGYTPYMSVLVNKDTHVPREYVRNGEIVLNVGWMATSKLELGNEFVSFNARFNGSAREIYVPVAQISAIYARETGQGMVFEIAKPLVEAGDEEAQTASESSLPSTPLRMLAPVSPPAESAPGAKGAVKEAYLQIAPLASLEPGLVAPEAENSDPAEQSPPPLRSKPTLTRVK
jgi:stringent starvation protein B